MDEMSEMIKKLELDGNVRAAVLISAKKGNFIAGADIKMLQDCKTEDTVYQISKSGQQILNKIANSSKPVIAAINGSCLGGGLEVTKIKTKFNKLITKCIKLIFQITKYILHFR